MSEEESGAGNVSLIALKGKALGEPVRSLLFSRKFLLMVSGVVTAILLGAPLEKVLDMIQNLILAYFAVNGTEAVVSIYKNGK